MDLPMMQYHPDPMMILPTIHTVQAQIETVVVSF